MAYGPPPPDIQPPWAVIAIVIALSAVLMILAGKVASDSLSGF